MRNRKTFIIISLLILAAVFMGSVQSSGDNNEETSHHPTRGVGHGPGHLAGSVARLADVGGRSETAIQNQRMRLVDRQPGQSGGHGNGQEDRNRRRANQL